MHSHSQNRFTSRFSCAILGTVIHRHSDRRRKTSPETSMRTSILCGLVVLSSSVLWAADEIQPLDVKLGLWETTWTSQSAGQVPIPPEAMANLTPEQRAK